MDKTLGLPPVAAVWHPPGAIRFQYRGVPRWSGPWDNPNIFGLLMGTGVVLGAGFAISGLRAGLKTRKSDVAVYVRRLKSHGSCAPLRSNVRASLRRLPLLKVALRLVDAVLSVGRRPALATLAWAVVVVGLCGLALLKSYSRGAWLGTACGLVALGFQAGIGRMRAAIADPPRRVLMGFCTSWRPLAVLLLSLAVLAFWEFRHTEFAPARRAFSVGNQNDFSWRNRVAAWEGALAMMADHPIAGLGWNQPERIYDQFYRAPKVAEGMAIQLNHYFMIGMSLGLPALFCFAMYAGLGLTRNAAGATRGREGGSEEMRGVCRAGAVVLLVGLWFDGGLFNLSTGALFWVLLECGQGRSFTEKSRPGGISTPVPCAAVPQMPWLKPAATALFLVALVLTGLAWAGARDPFHREWFTVRTSDGGKLSAVAVMPGRGGPFPVVLFSPGASASAQSSGSVLQQFAELGLAVVGMDYDKTNQARFDAQMAGLLDALALKPWAQSNRVAWAGHSLGAQRQLSFLARHPERQPTVMVRLNGGAVAEFQGEMGEPKLPFSGLNVWMVHGTDDQVFPLADVRHAKAALEAAGARVRLEVFAGRGHVFGEEQPLLGRAAAEFCARELGATAFVATNVRCSYWIYWAPVILVGAGLLAWNWKTRPGQPRATPPARWLSIGAGMVLVLAVLVSTAHLVLPRFHASPTARKVAGLWCARPGLRADFDWLVRQPGARSCRLGDLLAHLDLASVQRGQFAVPVSDDEWREFVVSPWIGGADDDVAWRRELWEWMAPRVRRETDIETAAGIVACEMRKRLRIVEAGPVRSVIAAWTDGATDAAGYERIYVAALRSIGIPARLNQAGICELKSATRWQFAPRPMLENRAAREVATLCGVFWLGAHQKASRQGRHGRREKTVS